MDDDSEEIVELGTRAEHWCMYHRATGAHDYSVNGRCRGCGERQGK